MKICRLAGLGEKIVPPPDKKDDFNFDDFQYSGVKLSPVPDFNQEVPETEPLSPPPESAAVEVPASPIEEALPLEPEDKKAKKKTKKEKPIKANKTRALAETAEGEKEQSAFLKELTKASPYTVLLGMTVVALLLAVVLLFIEFSRYDLNIHPPKSIQLSAAMNQSATAPFAGYCMAELEDGSSGIFRAGFSAAMRAESHSAAAGIPSPLSAET
jgi:hypothetical protein